MKKTKPAPKKTPAPAKAKAAKPAAKAAKPVKAAAKAAPAKAKVAAKAPAKAVKPAAKAAASKKAAKPEIKKAAAAKAKTKTAPAPKPAKSKAEAPAARPVAAKAAPAKAVKAVDAKEAVKETKTAKTKAEPKGKESPKTAPPVAEAFPALDDVKRPAKPFFMEVKPGVERVIKRGDKSAVSQVIDLQARRKGPTAEESAEELAERIERELQSQSFLKRARMRPQMCTKCGINEVTPRFTIDRELGYCELCAEILHLGETKEARRMEVSLAAKKDDEGEEGEDAEGPSPDEVEDIPEDVD